MEEKDRKIVLTEAGLTKICNETVLKTLELVVRTIESLKLNLLKSVDGGKDGNNKPGNNEAKS